MLIIRSAIFNLLYILWSPLIGTLCVPLLLFEDGVYRASRIWAGGILWMLKVICGITHEIKGYENLPLRPAIIASKHQSAWDTLIFFQLIKRPVYILKQELYFLPVVNLYMWAMGSVAINRSAKSQALKKVIKDSKNVIEQGKTVIIYPEGTRTQPGTSMIYRSGIAGIYKAVNQPVTPVALNSGLLWGKKSFLKKPGVITLQILPEIAPGLDKNTFMETLQERIESASFELLPLTSHSPNLLSKL